MEFILMIDESTVKATSFIDENVDVNLIRTTIKTAQDIHIVPILGTALTNEILTQIDGGTVSAANTTLLDEYLTHTLVWWTLYEGVDVFTYKFRNKGILRETSEVTQTISLEEVKRLMDSFKNKAEFYSERATKYLMENTTTYPLILNAGSGIDTVHPNITNYSTGWYLGGKYKCGPFGTKNNAIDL